jgi:AcrR family transcriptional regulator
MFEMTDRTVALDAFKSCVLTSATVTTREELLLAAERLFAVHGPDGVSLRKISASIGQRNVAATQYHFGDKAALIQAIFDFRLDRIDAHRRAMLAELRAAGRTDDVRALVAVLVTPLAEQAAQPGSHYVRFLNRMCEHQGRAVLPQSDVGPVNSAVEVGHLIIDALERLPGGVARGPHATQRSELAGRLIIVGLADLEQRLSDRPEDVDPRDYTDGLIDAVVGLLMAPTSGYASATPAR